MANRERDDNIYYARLAEQGERYEDMIRYMKEVAAVSIPSLTQSLSNYPSLFDCFKTISVRWLVDWHWLKLSSWITPCQFEMETTFNVSVSILLTFFYFCRWANCLTRRETCSLWPTRILLAAVGPHGVLSVPFKTVRRIRAASTLSWSTSTEKWSKPNLMESVKMCLTFFVMYWSLTQKSLKPKCSTWKCEVTTIVTCVNLPQVICKSLNYATLCLLQHLHFYFAWNRFLLCSD